MTDEFDGHEPSEPPALVRLLAGPSGLGTAASRFPVRRGPEQTEAG